jgi:ribosomal protein S18 acetylase RimI-like enzyme
MNKRQWTLRPFDEDADATGVLKLWTAIAGFDGSVDAPAPDVFRAIVETTGGASWRVALAGNGAIVGALQLQQLGTLRTSLVIAVNPSWRQMGIAKSMLAEAPVDKRLLVTTRASVPGTAELLTTTGFTERYREVRLRRAAAELDAIAVPDGATIVVDSACSPTRLATALKETLDLDDADLDLEVLGAQLRQPGTRALYLVLGGRDLGVCVVGASGRARRSERSASGEPRVGVVERVGLSPLLRGKGMSRSLVRAGLRTLVDLGYAELEVTADQRRPAAVDLYVKEGFSVIDEDVHWMRKERAPSASKPRSR